MSRVRAIHVALDKPCYATAQLTRCRLYEVARTKRMQRWLSLVFEFFAGPNVISIRVEVNLR
jgi:hypothetical protein